MQQPDTELAAEETAAPSEDALKVEVQEIQIPSALDLLFLKGRTAKNQIVILHKVKKLLGIGRHRAGIRRDSQHNGIPLTPESKRIKKRKDARAARKVNRAA